MGDKGHRYYSEITGGKILSSELKWDSFKLYHEDESIF